MTELKIDDKVELILLFLDLTLIRTNLSYNNSLEKQTFIFAKRSLDILQLKWFHKPVKGQVKFI